jgi:hypothetical protein
MIKDMAGRLRTWKGYEKEAIHKVTMTWPLSLWKKLQYLALEENTSAIALVIEATETLLRARKEQPRKSKKRS